ncbi:cell division protein FtsI [Ideonella azotifigens]|uniref:Cell division protein FtsI n=1 Tax=Ideonella azotifigens TaxID=513160 RepID=A0ABN1KM71_9BURK|nr:cell division protein FtsI [Ideonella azotifigens]MCD2343433.1 cell division protein FtsI [Ideonella azotifigens]
MRLIASSLSAATLVLSQTGCSLFSPVPLWELAKAGGTVASMALPYGEPKASDTVYHLHPRFHTLCIAFNPDTPAQGLVPALQAELRLHQIETRVYEGVLPERCSVSLAYEAAIGWEVPPLGGGYQAYLSTLALTLRDADGAVLSSSRYEVDNGLGWGKWRSTRSKVAPVVSALVTGFEN